MKTLRPLPTDTWASFSWKLFALFSMRNNGWTLEEVNEEKLILMTAGATPEANPEELKKAYYRIPRIGAHRRMNRSDRQSVLLTYGNACNHASIHFGEGNGY